MKFSHYLPSLIGLHRNPPKLFTSREPRHPFIPSEHRAFICPDCDVLLDDGAIYQWCPSCETSVDWVDLRKPVWSCPCCDAMSNIGLRVTPHCPSCQVNFILVSEAGAESKGPERAGLTPAGGVLDRISRALFSQSGLMALFMVASLPVAVLASLESYRWAVVGLLGPVVLLPIVASALWLGGLSTSFGQLRQLFADIRLRVVHGLEHGTIAVLREAGIKVRGGRTIGRAFDVFLPGDRLIPDIEITLERACREAIHRIRNGEDQLAYASRCGTSWLVGATLLSLFGLLVGGAGLCLTLPLGVVIGLYAVIALGTFLAMKPLGLLVQRELTVSTDFDDVLLVSVARTARTDRRATYRVAVEVSCKETGAPALPYR